MTSSQPPPFNREERRQVMAYLQERLARSVGIDVWTRPESGLLRTDRDACTHCDDVKAAMRQIATLHPALSFTPYDLERHADRATQDGVEMVPTTVLRGGGRSVQLVGLFSGLLFPAMLDIMAFLSNAGAPVEDETATALEGLEEQVTIEAMVTPFEPYSAHMARLLAAFATITRRIRLRVMEMSEFPILAGQRALTEVPTITINGRRFTGAWGESELVEQIRRVLAGDSEPVIRDRVLTARYLSEEEAHQLAMQQAEQHQHDLPGDLAGIEAPPSPRDEGPPPGGGLYIPGRD